MLNTYLFWENKLEEREMKKGKQRFLAATMALCLGYISCPLFAASATDTQNTPLTQTDISPRFSYIQRANADFYSSAARRQSGTAMLRAKPLTQYANICGI